MAKIDAIYVDKKRMGGYVLSQRLIINSSHVKSFEVNFNILYIEQFYYSRYSSKLCKYKGNP